MCSAALGLPQTRAASHINHSEGLGLSEKEEERDREGEGVGESELELGTQSVDV